MLSSITTGGSSTDSTGSEDGGDSSGSSGDTSSDTDYTSWFDRITQGISDVISNVASILGYINPFSENFILKNVLEFLGNIVDYINPFSDNFILKDVLDFLSNILDYLNPFSENFFGYKIIDLLSDLLEFLFVPSEERLTALVNAFDSKFDFVDSISYAVNSFMDIINGVGTAPTITFALGSTKYTPAFDFTFSLAWFEPYKIYSDLIITGFVYASFLWRLFIKLPATISGSSGTIEIVEKWRDKI